MEISLLYSKNKLQQKKLDGMQNVIALHITNVLEQKVHLLIKKCSQVKVKANIFVVVLRIKVAKNILKYSN